MVCSLAIFGSDNVDALSKMFRGGNMDSAPSCSRLPIVSNENDQSLAYHYVKGASPAVLFCNGYRSSMDGTKATTMERYCQNNALAFCRFDYRGHGKSTGNFLDCTLTEWVEDAQSIIDHILADHTRIIIVGSSMGAWIAIHVAQRNSDRVVGILGMASAPDFSPSCSSSAWRFSTYR